VVADDVAGSGAADAATADAAAGTVVAVADGATVAGTVERTVGTGFFFFVSVSAGGAGGGVATTWAGETETGCFLEGGTGIIYYFMITYIIICLYNFID
jgi:hypothetical protein